MLAVIMVILETHLIRLSSFMPYSKNQSKQLTDGFIGRYTGLTDIQSLIRKNVIFNVKTYYSALSSFV